LSDGKENNFRYIADVLPLVLGNGTIVHVVTIGADAAYEDMQDLAATTGGTYFHCFDPSSGDIPNDLAELYRAITEMIRPMERFYHARGSINPGNNREFKLEVTDDMDLVEFIVHYNASTKPTAIELKDPDGTPVVWDYEGDKSGMGRAVYRNTNPKVGEWTIKITISAASSELRYFVEGAAHTYITMTLLNPPNGYVSPGWSNTEPIGSKIPVLISLTDKKSIRNAKVYMDVLPPGYRKVGSDTQGLLFRIPLYDDGNHGDSLPGDGIYGNVYTPTSEEGSYQFTINATGTDNMGNKFTRIKTGAFYCYKYDWVEQKPVLIVPDTDRDGLPDHWEIFHGLDPANDTGIHGASGDPDLDILGNYLEFVHGTDPRNPDTDNGGQADGTEVVFKQNPLDPSDDNLKDFPSLRVFPGNGFIYILFPNSTTVPYEDIYMYRSTNPNFGYTLLNYSTYLGSYNDTAVANYQPYYYRFLGMTNFFNFSLSNVYKVIPKLSVIPPEASILINGGNKTTKSNLVTVKVVISKNDETKKMAFTPTQMRIGQTAEALFKSAWIPFLSEFPVLFPNETGVKFVFVQLRDNQVIPEVSQLFSAGILYTGEESVGIGLETTFTIVMITVDFIVISVIYYKKKRKSITVK
jgi:hypothetical protein